MTVFDYLVKLSCEFVENHKGKWDHSAWMGFLSEVQKTDGRLTESMQNYLGLILESIKRFNNHISDSSKRVMDIVCEETVRFIEQSRGVWDHSGWENFLSNIKNKGVHLTSEAIAQLGSILESTKLLYKSMPVDLKEEKVESVPGKEQIVMESEPQKPEEESKGETVKPPAVIDQTNVERETRKEEEEQGKEVVEPVAAQKPVNMEQKPQAVLEQSEKGTEPVVEKDNIGKKTRTAIDKPEISPVIPTKIQKLTKKQLIELAEGSYLVSHAVDEAGNPIFAQEVPSADKREDFWLKVRNASLNQRVCYLFQNKTEYVTFLSQQNEKSSVST